MREDKVIDPTALGLDVRKISGDEAYCVCPFHSDHTPSASLNIRSGKFFCYVCGAHHTVDVIARELGGSVIKVFVENLNYASHGEGWVDDWKWVLGCRKALNNEYLASRRVSNTLVDHFDIREFPKGIAFPMKDARGVIVGAQVRTYGDGDKRARYLTMGEKPPLWPMEKLNDVRTNTVLLVEGAFGVINAARHGYNNAFAILGSQSIASAVPFIRGFRNKFVAFDNDMAGQVAAAKAMVVHSGIRAYMPGVEADEARKEFFDKLFDGSLRCITYYEDAYRFTERPAEANRLVNNFIHKQYKSRK